MKKSNMINVPVEFVIDALQARYDEVKEMWGCDASASLWEQALQSVAECGLGENVTSPSIYVDSYLINGNFLSKKNDVEYWISETSYSDANYGSCEYTLNSAWDEYCQDNALIYNGEYTCLQF